MTDIVCHDLLHLSRPGAIAAYLVLGSEPTLVDPGPSTTLPRLLEGLGTAGVSAADLRHIVLTHVHLDHAGATGDLVEAFPRATVHVHADGAPHMVDPGRLVASTRRTFGDAHDRLWGDVRPVPAHRVRAWRPGEAGPWPGFRALATPGHIAHHVAYLHESSGTLFSGDSMGIVLVPGAPTHPPTPPPAIDLKAWARTLQELSAVGAERFGATHFGLHGEVAARAEQLAQRLATLQARVREAMARGDDGDAIRYDREVRDELAPFVGRDEVEGYFDMFTAATDWAGVRFYLERNG